MLTLEPTVALEDLTTDDARRLADAVAELTEADDAAFWVRFAPEMNGSWTPWGQQPAAHVAAFRTLADVVHTTAPGAATTWALAYGAGYPFGTARGEVEGSGPREQSALDTDGDGAVADADDPCAPYWPGPEHVDARSPSPPRPGRRVLPASDHRALSRVRGKVLVTALMTAYVGTLVALCPGSLLHVEPLEGGYDRLYWTLYQRTDLQVGRLVDLAMVVVVAYAVLTTMWKPVNAAVGWFSTPLGTVSLYVFIVHVFVALPVGTIPGLDRTDPWVGTAVHAAVLALVRLMVRSTVGFRLLPT
ncbi:MAG: acyltransferase protein [Klenkia sp.]|nr:acyltransferase protein [Klenkia sp.]